jgi:hypothetical protein
MDKKTIVSFMIFSLAFLTILGGCGGSKNQVDPFQKESLLRQAGFDLRSAKNPEQLNIINSMPPDKLVSREYKGKLFYLYQDPLSKDTVYVGNEQAHAKLMELIDEYKMNKMHGTVERAEDLWSGEFVSDPSWNFLDPLP